jgi:hypothetical protein
MQCHYSISKTISTSISLSIGVYDLTRLENRLDKLNQSNKKEIIAMCAKSFGTHPKRRVGIHLAYSLTIAENIERQRTVYLPRAPRSLCNRRDRKIGQAGDLVIFIAEDLFASLSSGHSLLQAMSVLCSEVQARVFKTYLLLLSHLGGCEFLGFLVAFNLVALYPMSVIALQNRVRLVTYHGIEFLLFIVVLVRQSGASALALDPVVA